MNQFRKKPASRRPRTLFRSVKARRLFIRIFKALNLFGYLEIRTALTALPFILFLSVLALLFIANSYYTERTLRAIDKTSREIKELKSEYITSKSDLMIKSGQSQVATAVSPLELVESREAPARLRSEPDAHPRQ